MSDLGPVRTIRWDRQHRRNALDPASLERVAAAIADATADPSIRCCVLTGAGDVAFSAGMDLKALADDRAGAGRAVAAWNGALDDPDRVVLVAAVDGMAMGGGFEIALRCDLIVAAAHATFGLPEVTRGIVPRGGALDVLPAILPVQAALELTITGEHLPASRLHDLGIVNRVVREDALAAAQALAAQVAEYPAETVDTIVREVRAAASAGRT